MANIILAQFHVTFHKIDSKVTVDGTVVGTGTWQKNR